MRTAPGREGGRGALRAVCRPRQRLFALSRRTRLTNGRLPPPPGLSLNAEIFAHKLLGTVRPPLRARGAQGRFRLRRRCGRELGGYCRRRNLSGAVRVPPPGLEAVGSAGNGGKVRPCLSAGRSVGHGRGEGVSRRPLWRRGRCRRVPASSLPSSLPSGLGEAAGTRARCPGRGAVRCGGAVRCKRDPGWEPRFCNCRAVNRCWP